MESRYDADFLAALQVMQAQDSSPFMAAVLDLLNDIYKEHQLASEGGKCTSSACECWSDPVYSIDWPCSWWMGANRIAMSWLLECAQGTTQSPEERAREQARVRKQRQREREAAKNSAEPPPTSPRLPESQLSLGVDSAREARAEAGAQAGAEAGARSQVRSQGESQSGRTREAVATQVPRQVS